VASDAKARAEREAAVAGLAWADDFHGRLTDATAASIEEIPKLSGGTVSEGVLLIVPDEFGAGGTVVKEIPSDQLPKRLADAMREALKSHVRTQKTRRQLAEKGLKEGVFYETGIPVSGKGQAADRERYKMQLDQKKKKD
jgi:hypothetical protein